MKRPNTFWIALALWWRATYNATHRAPGTKFTIGQWLAFAFTLIVLEPILFGGLYNELFTNNFGPDSHQPAPILLLLVFTFLINRRAYRAFKGGRLPYVYPRHFIREFNHSLYYHPEEN